MRPTRLLGPVTLRAAMTAPVWFEIGTATVEIPSIRSSNLAIGAAKLLATLDLIEDRSSKRPELGVQPNGLVALITQLRHDYLRNVLQVDVRERDLSETKKVGTERIVPAAGDLLNELVPVQGGKEPVNRASTEPRDARDLGHAQLGPFRSKRIENGHGAVEGLHGLLSAVLHSGMPSRVVVVSGCAYHTNASRHLSVSSPDEAVP